MKEVKIAMPKGVTAEDLKQPPWGLKKKADKAPTRPDPGRWRGRPAGPVTPASTHPAAGIATGRGRPRSRLRRPRAPNAAARRHAATAAKHCVDRLGGALERTVGALEPYFMQLRIKNRAPRDA